MVVGSAGERATQGVVRAWAGVVLVSTLLILIACLTHLPSRQGTPEETPPTSPGSVGARPLLRGRDGGSDVGRELRC